MGLNHDLEIMKNSPSLAGLLAYIDTNSEAIDTYKRHYHTILLRVLESQISIHTHVFNADTQSLVLSYMAFHGQNPSRAALVEKAEKKLPLLLGFPRTPNCSDNTRSARSIERLGRRCCNVGVCRGGSYDDL